MSSFFMILLKGLISLFFFISSILVFGMSFALHSKGTIDELGFIALITCSLVTMRYKYV